ncbi:DUF1540 domain-containing protein [Kineococcus sp. NPDC059986]|jgi:hypothetical protein|uniref:DUF1540 domain-containing protein n=1 Tax=Kineococcus sp. NPDC059986 TaxID=3155538 RepID=UPI00344B651F
MATVNLDLTPIHQCSAEGCTFNASTSCHAPAITVGDHGANHCATFLGIPTKHSPTTDGHVGACQLSDCSHNSDLTCTASTIEVGSSAGGGTECLTYSAA